MYMTITIREINRQKCLLVMDLATHHVVNDKEQIYEVWSRYCKKKVERGDNSENIGARVTHVVTYDDNKEYIVAVWNQSFIK